jgi:hypothetical protein
MEHVKAREQASASAAAASARAKSPAAPVDSVEQGTTGGAGGATPAPGGPVEHGAGASAAAPGDATDDATTAADQEKEQDKAMSAAYQHFDEEMKQCKDCKCARADPEGGLPCGSHQLKVMRFAGKLLKQGNGAGGATPAAPGGPVETTSDAPVDSVEQGAGGDGAAGCPKVLTETERHKRRKCYGEATQHYDEEVQKCWDCHFVQEKRNGLLGDMYCPLHQEKIDSFVRGLMAEEAPTTASDASTGGELDKRMANQ